MALAIPAGAASDVATLLSDAERELGGGLGAELLSAKRGAIARLADKLRPARALAIAKSGVPALLVALLAPSNSSPELQGDALALLASVVQRSRTAEACEAVVAAGAVAACVRQLSEEGKQRKTLQRAACAALNSLMCGSVRARGIVADSGLLQRAVADAQAERQSAAGSKLADRPLNAARLLRAVGSSCSRSAAGSELVRAAVEAGALEGLCEALRTQKRNVRRVAAEAIAAFARGGPIDVQAACEAGVFDAVVEALMRVRLRQTLFGPQLGEVEHECVRRPCLEVIARAAAAGSHEQVTDLVACGAVTSLANELERDNDEAVVLVVISALGAILESGEEEFEGLNEHSAVFAAARVPELVEALVREAESSPAASATADSPPPLVHVDKPGLAAAAAARAFLKQHYPNISVAAPAAQLPALAQAEPAAQAAPAAPAAPTALDVVTLLVRALRLD
jgi:hypothetical protein